MTLVRGSPPLIPQRKMRLTVRHETRRRRTAPPPPNKSHRGTQIRIKINPTVRHKSEERKMPCENENISSDSGWMTGSTSIFWSNAPSPAWVSAPWSGTASWVWSSAPVRPMPTPPWSGNCPLSATTSIRSPTTPTQKRRRRRQRLTRL